MNTPKRFNLAIRKLYTAFHNDTLYPECCQQCAVGSILDGKDMWKHFSDFHGDLNLNYVGKVHEMIGRKYNGYLPSELLKIECAFLKACEYSLPYNYNGNRPENPQDKDLLFKGLCAVVELLCKLDNIDNVMEYSQLFKPTKQKFRDTSKSLKLSEVIV